MNYFGAQNMVSRLKKVLMKKPQKFMSKVDLQKWNYTSPLDQDFINTNYNEFHKIIKSSENLEDLIKQITWKKFKLVN